MNRELSWLDFNERVLALAEDESIPLLERVKFLAIYAANLDEFYMVRVAGLHDQVDAGIDARGRGRPLALRDDRPDRRARPGARQAAVAAVRADGAARASPSTESG